MDYSRTARVNLLIQGIVSSAGFPFVVLCLSPILGARGLSAWQNFFYIWWFTLPLLTYHYYKKHIIGIVQIFCILVYVLAFFMVFEFGSVFVNCVQEMVYISVIAMIIDLFFIPQSECDILGSVE